MKLSEKVAYLKGLEEGLNLDAANAENKLLKGIIEAFDDIVAAVDQNAGDIKEMTDRVDEIDMDLGDLEAILFEGFEIEELTEEEFDDLAAGEDEAFEVVYTSDEAPEEEAEAAADELFADAPAEDTVEETVEEDVVEEPVVEEEAPVEEIVEEAPVKEEAPVEEEELDDDAIFAAADEVVAEAEAAEAAAAAAVAWPEEEPVVDEPVEEVVEREAEPEEDTYEVECPSCGHVMFIDDSILAQGGIECPKCHEKLEFEVEYED